LTALSFRQRGFAVIDKYSDERNGFIFNQFISLVRQIWYNTANRL